MECIHETNITQHILNDNWTFWIHLPHDINWDINSYKQIYTFNTLENGIALIENLKENLVTNCMLFLMRKDILPIWEDNKNKNGGCISYKINNKIVFNIWKNLCFALIGETLAIDENIQKKINGITISPKKNFCIIKIWFDCYDDNIRSPNIINNISNINDFEGIFKKHIT